MAVRSTWKLTTNRDVTADRDARCSDGSDEYKGVRQ